MRVLLSTWKPWTNVNVSLQDRVDMAKECRAELCLKGSNSTYIYGPETWNIFKVWPYKGKSNDDLERLAKSQGVKVQLWDFPYLQHPQGSANAVNESISRWNPADVDLDVEGSYAKNYPYGTGPFLRGLGQARAKFWLQSYRKPKVHPEIVWLKWLKYKDPMGNYLIYGLAPQAYPIWSTNWPGDFKQMVDQYEAMLAPIGRIDMPWFVTLPTFSERGWMPKLPDLIQGVDYLVERLGDRLVGLNFWRQGFLFRAEFQPIYSYIKTLAKDVEPPPVVRNDWFTQMDDAANRKGWGVLADVPPEAHSHEGGE